MAVVCAATDACVCGMHCGCDRAPAAFGRQALVAQSLAAVDVYDTSIIVKHCAGSRRCQVRQSGLGCLVCRCDARRQQRARVRGFQHTGRTHPRVEELWMVLLCGWRA